MSSKTTFWERVGDFPVWKLMAGVFLFALSARLVVTLIFFSRWGWHTVSGIELWFYYGVAKGTFDLYSIWDPTWWFLSAVGALFRGEGILYATYLTSSLHSSLNAAVFCLFVSELHGKKTGLLAGLIYGTMVLPMFNSSGTVTHDIFAYPWLILTLYGTLMVFRRKGLPRILFAALALVSLFLGAAVGPTIMVAGGTVLVYLLWRGIRSWLSPVVGRRYVVGAVMLAAVTVLVTLGYNQLHYVHRSIFWKYAPDYLAVARNVAGQRFSFNGVVVRAEPDGPAGDVRLYFDGDDPQQLTILLPAAVVPRLPFDPAAFLTGKMIVTSGLVETAPRPVLRVNDPDDLVLARPSYLPVLVTVLGLLYLFLVWQLIRVIRSRQLYRWGAAVTLLLVLPTAFFINRDLRDTTGKVSWRSEYLGRNVTVRGRVSSVDQFAPGSDLFLGLGRDDARRLWVMVSGDRLSRFPSDPRSLYRDETVTATGQVVWGTNPVVIVNEPDSLKVVSSGWGRIAIGAAVLLALFALLYFYYLRWGFEYFSFISFLVMIIGLLSLIYLTVMPLMMDKTFNLALGDRGINVLNQIKAGSGDLLGSSLGDYWLRFNFLFFFLPVGVYVAVKKKDMLGLVLLMTGYLASRTADRGTRPLSFGFALMGALAFINWRPAYGWILAAWMTYIIGEFGGRYSTEYAVFFPVCALFIYYFIQWPGEERRSGTSLLVYSLSLFAILFGFVFLSSASLRESWGLFTVPYLPGGLLKTAPGFTYLFILLGAATAALIVYTLHQGITRSRRPGWIRAVVALTLVWLFLGAVLGGAVFRAKELGKPEQLRALEGLGGLTQPEQVAAVNSVLARLNELMELLRQYWSVQVCLLAAGLLMVLLAATRPRGEGKERKLLYLRLKITALFTSPFILFLLVSWVFFPAWARSQEIPAPAEIWKYLRFIAPPLFGLLLFILYRPRGAAICRSYPSGAALICWLFAAIIPSMNQTAKSTEGEYRLYSWLGRHSGGEGRIFVPWSDGYMAEAISGVKSELSPEKIDFQLPRLYWMTEEAAALALRSRSIDYIVVSSKYFKLLRYSDQSGEFQYSFSPDIIYQPQQVGINTMDRLQETALFKMLYRTRELEHFRPLHLERDPAVNETTILFEVRTGK